MAATTGFAADVPYLVVPPDGGARVDAPVVVGWHLLDAPRTETAFHAAVPLSGLDAWRVYLGLPLSGARLPDGGRDELLRLGAEDAVRRVYGPVNAGAAGELDAVLDVLRARYGFTASTLGVFGGSAGAGVAAEVLTRRRDVAAAVLISPVLRLRALVERMEAQFGVVYPWDDTTDAIAARMDYLARARDLGVTPIRVVVGGQDDAGSVLDPAAALVGRVTGPADVVVVPGMGHALADEPGTGAAPQTRSAAAVDTRAVEWFRRHLHG